MLRSVLYVTFNPTIANPNILSAYMATCTLMAMSFTSEMIQSFGLLTAVREDAFGVRSPVMQIIEWQVTVPFLFYLCIALDIQREELTMKDVLIILLGGWFGIAINVPILIFNHNLVVGWICATLSLVLLNGATMLNLYDADLVLKNLDTSTPETPLEIISVNLAKRRRFCCLYMSIVTKIYPIIYFSRALGALTHDMTFAMFCVLNFLTKICFANVLLEGYMEMNAIELLAKIKKKEDKSEEKENKFE